MLPMLSLLLCLSFGAEISYTLENATQAYVGPSLLIPEYSYNAERPSETTITLTFPESTGPVMEIYFEMYIKHPYQDDLEIVLERDGYEYWLLYDWDSCSGECIGKDFGTEETPFVLYTDSDYDYEDFEDYGLTKNYQPDESLSDLFEESGAGDWIIHFRDDGVGDQGELISFKIVLEVVEQ